MLAQFRDTLGRWVPPSLRAGQSIDHQRFHADASELQILAGERSRSDATGELDTAYKPHLMRAKTTAILHAPKTTATKVLGPRFAGWRFGALNFAIWASIVFLINFIVTIWGLTAGHFGRGVLLEGDCDRVKKLNTGLHVFINILGTILLSGSNYCMQALSAPTLSEVRTAHASGKWLDVGVPGISNLRHISKRRVVLWSLLGLSSLPLHLFYNSAVFASISSNSYFAYSVSQSFLDDAECRNCSNDRPYTRDGLLETLWDKARADELDRLSPSQCLNEYASIIQSDRRNVLLIASDANFPPPDENTYMNGSRAYWSDSFNADSAEGTTSAADAYGWICSGLKPEYASNQDQVPCSDRVDEIKSATNAWRVGRYCYGSAASHTCVYDSLPVEYCLSEKAAPHCKLHFEPTIAIIITILNLVKAALMFYIAFGIEEDPLMNMGDAVASFLGTRDPATKNMCLASFQDFKSKKGYVPGPRQWHNTRYRWKDVTSKTRRLVTLTMFLIALAVVSVLLYFGINSLADSSIIYRISFGAVDPRTAIVGMPHGLIPNVVIANSPQLILSFLYFSYNALFTAMLMGYEWTTYAFKRKGLRISRQSEGAQRSTYFLQLPYRFGIPLMILSGTLHWLVSQSIFLIAIDYYDAIGNPGLEVIYSQAATDYKTLGFSPSAIISVIVMGSLMVISIIGFGFVPYKRGMPLAGSCSMAISAACHVDEHGTMAATQQLQWGVVSKSLDGIGHCAFSTEEVEALVDGETYA